MNRKLFIAASIAFGTIVSSKPRVIGSHVCPNEQCKHPSPSLLLWERYTDSKGRGRANVRIIEKPGIVVNAKNLNKITIS
jgi:hypothetical protein